MGLVDPVSKLVKSHHRETPRAPAEPSTRMLKAGESWITDQLLCQMENREQSTKFCIHRDHTGINGFFYICEIQRKVKWNLLVKLEP